MATQLQDPSAGTQFAMPPGETLAETLEALGMAQAELAERMGRPLKTINEIVAGKAMITADTVLQLEKVLGVPASFWTNRERLYRDTLARRRETGELGIAPGIVAGRLQHERKLPFSRGNQLKRRFDFGG